MEWVYSVFNLLGGLAIFMYGMKIMSDNLERMAGKNMKGMLARVSNNRFAGVGIGFGVTAIIQSSSATTVMLVGFVNIGLMTLTQAAAIIMGANIGTTITLQITSLKNVFNITAIAGLIAAAGMFMNMFSCKNNLKRTGVILIGLGMIFIGLEFMSISTVQFRKPLSVFFALIDNPFLLILFGIIFTGIVQSSSASTIIVAGFAASGAIGLEAAMYAILGMNIGTCVTAMLSSIGTNVNAKRTAWIHLLFNISGTVMVVILFMVIGFKNVYGFIYAISGADIMRQVANFHTVFNIFTTIILLPFINGLVKLSTLIVPGKDQFAEAMRLHYIDERVLKTPPIAVSQMNKEVANMAAIAKKNLDMALEALLNTDISKANEINKREEEINYLNKAITGFLVRISSLDISYEDEKIIGSYFNVVTDIERIGDHADNIFKFTQQMYDENIIFSQDANNELKNFADILNRLYDNTMQVFVKRKLSCITEVNKYEDAADQAKRDMVNAHIRRLNKGECSAESGTIYLSLASNLERVADHLTNIAESVLSYTKEFGIKKKAEARFNN